MEKYGMIYKTTCLVNDKIYIGQTRHINDDEYLGSGTAFLKALRKYGRKNFKREILHYCVSQKDLDAWELVMIKRYNSTDRKVGYNILHGTANRFGNGSCATFPIVREKISKSLTGKLVGKKNPNFGHYWSNEKKARLSATLKIKARRWSEEEKRAISEKRKGMLIGEKNPMFGKKHTLLQKQKISTSTKLYFAQHPEAIEKISNSSQRFWDSKDSVWREQHFKKISEQKQKRVIVFTLDLSKIYVCKSYKEANVKIGKKGVSSVMRGVTTHVNGFICREFNVELLKTLLIRKREDKVIKHKIGYNGKVILLESI